MLRSIPLALTYALDTLLPALDIVAQRVDDASIPAWCERRGWDRFLLGLGEQDVAQCESDGLAVVATSLSGVPDSLAELASRVRALSALPALAALPVSARPALTGVKRRKQQQLSALFAALPPFVERANRIVDVGAGSGHLTRLSARHFQREALGLERDPARVARASLRDRADGSGPFAATFSVVDVLRDGLALRNDDLAIGLHACGELGDALVKAVAAQRADLVLVSCCLQKIGGPRRWPLSVAARNLSLHKETLGLSNLSSQALGVETNIERTMQAREARYALRLLLHARGVCVEPGAEMNGINRRRAHLGFAPLAERAFALRALPAPSDAELRETERVAVRDFAKVRRLSLARDMLARVIELSVVLDRAAFLVECGFAVRVATLFERAVTPRNIALFASRDAARLPEVRSAIELS